MQASPDSTYVGETQQDEGREGRSMNHETFERSKGDDTHAIKVMCIVECDINDKIGRNANSWINIIQKGE